MTARAVVRRAVREMAALIPPHVRLGRRYRGWRRFLDVAQGWDLERIEAWQLTRLRKIVTLAYERTAGYRQLWDEAGVSPADLRALEDLTSFPMVTKALIGDNLDAFSVPGARGEPSATGGSTGTPFTFRQPRELRMALEPAFIHASWSWMGWRLGMKAAVLRGAFVGTPTRWHRYDRLHRELHLSTYQLVPARARAYLDQLNRDRCDVVHAYPSQFFMFADLVGEQLGAPAAINARWAFLGSENVYDWQLDRCQDVFPNVVPFAWYGHTEKAVLAPWCEKSRRHHTWPFYGLGEVVDAKGVPVVEGEIGEIVGTSFHNDVTPFIRYRTDDHAERGADRCPDCGRNFRLMSSIVGRGHEVVVSRHGRHISMTALAGSIHGDIFDAVKQFQFRQTEPGVVTFLYVTRESSRPDADRLRHDLQRIFGDDINLQVQLVDEIKRTSSGKTTYLDQRLPVRYGADSSPA